MVCETVPSTWPDHGTGNVAVISLVVVINFKAFILTKKKEIISISHQFKMIAELIFCHTI